MIRVKKEDLRLGMYIQSLEGSWFDHPFWKSKFLLTEEDDLRSLQGSDVDVWVDESKSLAPALAHLMPQEPTPRSRLLEELAPEAPVKAASTPKPRSQRPSHPNEFHAAETVLADCKAAVGQLFARVQSGSAAAIEDAAPVVRGIAESVERNPDALITLTRVRTLDEYTYMHSVAVSALMINLARQLQLPPDYIKQAGTAGLFMDVGKAFLPSELLGKRNEYGPADWAEMRRHPQPGADAGTASGDLSKIGGEGCLEWEDT